MFGQPDPVPGDRVGAYEVVGDVARGGMATVLEVRDTRTDDIVAMKLLLPLEKAEEARGRFRREFRALSRLSHPNVLKVFESGLIGDRPWFTMELVRGRTLKEEVASLQDLPRADRFTRVLALTVQIARALAYIHERGMIHRDITPANIMVADDGAVKLMDFGVVKDFGHADLTAAGELVGTVAYIAPEQIGGDHIDQRADLYALGAVLYLLLTGQRPFSAHTMQGYLEMHLNRMPKRPKERDPLVPDTLDEVCMRLLQKDANDRYASAAHLLHVLGDTASTDEAADKWPPRMVGRTTIKARMRDSLDDVAAERPGTALMLRGSAGMGKTRMLDLGGTLAKRRALLFARGRCRPHDRPFGAFVPIYRALVERDETAPEVLEQVLGETPAEGHWERYPILTAFRDLVVRHAPVVIALDDLHKADPATIELLNYLVRNTLELAAEPVVFLLTSRSADPSGDAIRAFELDALELAEVEELVLTLVDHGAAASALARRLYKESNGAPAFIADMLRGLVDEGLLTKVEGSSRLQLTLDAAEITRSRLPMPASLRQALQDRIAPLSRDAVELARIVAISRMGLDVDAVGDLAPFDDDDRFMAALDDLVDARIVRERQDRVELAQSRFRDVLLDDLDDLPARHQRVGEDIERRYRSRLGGVVEELAFHFREAGLAPKAYAYLTRTGQRHLARSLYEESLVFLDRALEIERVARPLMILEEADTKLASLYLGRSQARNHLGQWQQALVDARKAARIASPLDDARLKSRIACELGMQLRNTGDTDAAERELRSALQYADEAHDPKLRPLPLYQLGGLIWGRGDLDQAEAHWKDSLDTAILVGDERAQGSGYNGLAILAICRGQTMQARQHLEKSSKIFERLGMLGPLVITRVNLIETYLNQGVLRRALQLADRTVAQAREVNHVHGIALGLAWRAQVLRVIGRRDEALANANEALRLLRELGSHEDEVVVLATLVHIRLSRREHPEALQVISELEPILADHDHEGIAPVVRAWKAQALAKLKRFDDARSIAEAAKETDTLWPHVRVRLDLARARVWRLLDEADRAKELGTRALATAEANSFRYYQLAAHANLAGVVQDEAARSRHRRVASGLARSLAANLPRSDAAAFLSRGWGEGAIVGR